MIATIIILIALVLAFLNAKESLKSLDPKKDPTPITFLPAVGIVLLGIIIASIQPFNIERVDAGHIGIKVNLTGDERGVSKYTYKTGWVVYNSWIEDLYEFPTFQQHIEYPDQVVITKGGFQTTIKPTFNYSLKATQVGDMFEKLRKPIDQVEEGWLKTAIIGSVNDVANKWAVDDIFNNREKFEAAIVAECNKRVIKWFDVSQLRTNIVPPEALQSAIIAKTKAIQDAQASLQKALVADAQAKEKIAIAKGDSAEAVINAAGRAQAVIIEAEGEAKAMKLKQSQVTSLYIDYIRANKWNGEYPTTMLGSGGNMIYNLK